MFSISIIALKMLQPTSIDEKTHTLVEYSSGSAALSIPILAQVLHNIDNTRAFLSSKKSAVKLSLMRFFGLRMLVSQRYLSF